jgi:phosphatidylglycerol:prolipoprotein diacylglycerol transferase
MLLAVNFPSWLKPEVIPGLPVRWYGVMYIVAFGIAFFLYQKQVRERNFPIKEDELSGLFFWGILGLVLGARIFSTLVYESSPMYIRQPWKIFWPFQDGQFTGLSGMSYHGGVIGAIVGLVMYSIRHRFDFRETMDMACASIPLGYTAGRIGNFINAELYGRVTTGPFGMIFPDARPFSINESWVREVADKTGVVVHNGMVNLPRHPSQLYEAFFEGIVLWLIVWFFRNRKPFKGFLIGLYIAGYGLIRFFLEYFREPDAHLGYRITLVKTNLPPALFSSLFNFTTGQVFCFIMIVAGLAWIALTSRLPDREPVFVYPTQEEAAKTEKQERSNQQRRQRRKLLKKK